MSSRGWLLGGLGSMILALACDGRHDALARRDGTGGKPARGGASALGGFPSVASGGMARGGGGGKPPDEPPGATVLTLVHGLVDAERVLVCFAVGVERDAKVLGMPQPEAGLGYAESFVARLDVGIDFAKEALEPLVIAGDLELVAGLDCEQALEVARAEQAAGEPAGSGGRGGSGGSSLEAGGAAGEGSTDAGAAGQALPDPPRLRVADLPTIPAGSLIFGRSYLYVGNGCLGGPAFSSPRARAACGEAYTPRLPTASAVLVAMSRKVVYGKLGLQAVHASVATRAIEVTSMPPDTSTDPPRYIAADVELGAIVPREPRLDFSVADSGANDALWRLEATQGSVLLFDEPWPQVLRRAKLAELSDTKTYALVFVGPSADLRASGFWNPPAFAVVSTDPPAFVSQ